MTAWEFFDKQVGRLLRAMPGWPDGRGLVGVAAYALSVGVLVVYVEDPSLRNDDFFKTVATAIIITGFVNSIIGWAYGDTARSAKSTDNTGKFADAVTELARKAPDQVGDPNTIRDGDALTVHKDPPGSGITEGP